MDWRGRLPAWAGPVLGYAGAVGLASAATVIRLLVDSVVYIRLVGWTFFPAVVAAALFLGPGPGLLCAGLCTLAVWTLVMHPVGEMAVASPGDVVVTALFAGVAGVMAVVASSYRRASGRVRAALAESRELVERESAAREQSQRASAALRESEERFRMMAETVPEALFTAGPDGWHDYVSPRFYEYTGLAPGGAEGHGWTAALHPDDRARARADWGEAIRTGEPLMSEYRLRAASGAHRWFLVRAAPMHVEGAPTGRAPAVRWFGVAMDVHDQRQAQQELAAHRDRLEELVQVRTRELDASHQRLRLSERLAALGTLSAGLGHDLGNLLLPIRTRLDVLGSRDIPVEAKEDVAAITQCAQHLQSLAKELRTFARSPDESHEEGRGGSAGVTDVAAWWRESAAFFANLLPRDLMIEWTIQRSLPPVRVVAHRLTQVMVNLLSNARDALGGRAAGRGAEPGRITVRFEAQGGAMVRLTVADNGPGMTEEVRARALEPFFTTKTRGVATGTGLGLALVHEIVQEAGGTVEIESQAGAGARVVLVLPAGQRDAGTLSAGTDKDDDPAVQEHAVRRACVIIEDRRVGSLVSSLLASLGYAVCAGRGEGADRDEADLWVTDGSDTALAAARTHAAAVGGERGGAASRAGDRRIVVMGEGGAEWERLGAVVVGAGAGPSRIVSAVRAMTGEGGGEQREETRGEG